MLSQTLYTLAFAALTFLQLVSASPISPRGSTKPGIVYSPYTGTPGNSRCKTTQEMTSDIASISSQGKYGFIRLYNLDCSQVTVVLPLAQKCGMQVMLGIWDVQDMTTQVNLLSQYVGDNWDAVHSVMIGNEFILDGTCTASQMVSYTIDARTKLRAKGYTGPVATVNVFYQVMQDKSLCDSQDFIAVNCHPFFDGSVAAEDAGTWVENMRQQVSTACGGKYTLITETGWPWKGDTNGKAVPSLANQQAALASLRKNCNDRVEFTAFNDYWKPLTPATQNAEPYWGILNPGSST